MSDDDLYFTHAIVGAPQTVFLGDRVAMSNVSMAGMQVNLDTGKSHISEGWQTWMALYRHDSASGLPVRRPSRLQRWLLRHTVLISMVVFVLGVTALIASIVVHYL